MVSTSPMRRPCLYVKVISLGWLLPNVLIQTIIVSGMEIKSQSLRKILLPEFNAMDLYTPWRFSLVPIQIDPMVLGAWVLRGIYYSCT